MKWLLAAVVLSVASTATAQPVGCSALESGVDAEVDRAAVAQDELGVFRSINDLAITAVKQCPQSTRLWYLAARSAEVLDAHAISRSASVPGGLQQIVADALAHAASSAAVTTVAARVRHSVALARQALALDPGYQPARRALAEALAADGSIAEALRVAAVDARPGLMHLTRARVLRAAKRPADAVTEVGKVGAVSSDELSPSRDVYRDTQEVLGLALLDLNRTAEARRALRSAAAAGSLAAQRALAK